MQKLIQSFKNREKFFFKSQGSSMLPILKHDDVVHLQKIKLQKPRVNDIVLIQKRKRVMIHRITYKNNNYFITKGDNNLKSDGKIYPHQIIGKVYQVKRKGKIFNLEDYYLIQSSQYFQEIVKIKQVLEAEKIDFVFLKGLPIYLYFEKSHPRRIYADCDLLVDKESWSKVERIFNRFKYTKKYSNIFSPDKPLKKATELNFYKKINDLLIIFDIHLEFSFLVNRYGRIDMLYPQEMIDKLTTQVLNEKQYVKIFSNPFPILSPSDLIVFLSLHFFHHNFRGAFRLEFLDKVIKIENRKLKTENKKGVFGEVWKKIGYYHLNNFVYPVFVLLRKYYSTSLPREFLDLIKPDEEKLSYIKKNISNINIFDGETRIQAGMNRFKNLFFLSPNPLWKRLMIVINLQVIYSVFRVMIFFLRRSFNQLFRSV